MADLRSDELIAELSALKQRAAELREQHRRTYKQISAVFAKIRRRTNPAGARSPLNHLAE
jgi:hypothetical protein